MSKKIYDNHNRWRNKTVAFRVSAEEDLHLEKLVKLTGLTKQDYIIRRLLCRDVVVQGNPRVYKALRDQLAAVLDELRRIEAGKNVDDELLDTIRMIATIMNGMQEDFAYGKCGKNNPAEDDFEEFYRQIQRMQDPAYLHTVTLDELMEQVFQGKAAVVENLLYTGAYILAGAPKIGKSFLVAQIAYHISSGRPLWGYQVRQGTVLYLALEDDEGRLQRRMYRMFGVEGANSLYFATNAKLIGGGLDGQLENFVQEHRDTRLIVIDTLQKVRETVNDSYSYSSDYDVIGKLKQFADKHGVCVLIVHHTRKQPAGDSFEMISGTTGLLGCADGALLMQKEKRTDGKATLDIVGRDQPDQRLYLTKDQEHLVWELERAENELWKQPPDPVLEAVSKMVSAENPDWEGSPTELAETLQTDMAVNRLTKHLNVNASRLLEEHHVKYENKTKHAGRRIHLTYMVVELPAVAVTE